MLLERWMFSVEARARAVKAALAWLKEEVVTKRETR